MWVESHVKFCSPENIFQSYTAKQLKEMGAGKKNRQNKMSYWSSYAIIKVSGSPEIPK